MKTTHEPVLLKEVVEALHIKNRDLYIDATLGAGGHSIEIIKKGGIVLGIDADKQMLEIAKENLRLVSGGSIKFIHGNFREVKKIAESNDFGEVSGIIADLGVSMLHYKELGRGFSFDNKDAPLDMRLDPDNQSVTAADLLNSLRADQLQSMLAVVLEYKEYKTLTRRIVSYRQSKKFKTVGDLLNITKSFSTPKNKNPATKSALALRIAVNTEFESLKTFVPAAIALLKKGGRLVVITFHSSEDAVLKKEFKKYAMQKKVKIITKRPTTPSSEEIKINKSARSAKLRVIEKT